MIKIMIMIVIIAITIIPIITAITVIGFISFGWFCSSWINYEKWLCENAADKTVCAGERYTSGIYARG